MKRINRHKGLVRMATVLFSGALVLSACDKKDVADKGVTPATEKTNIDAVATAAIANPSEFSRPDELVYFSYYNLGLATGQTHYLSADSGGQKLDSQAVDMDFDGVLDGLLVRAPLGAGEKMELSLKAHAQAQAPTAKRTQAEISIKEGGQWVEHSKYKDTQYREYVGGSFKNVYEVTPPDVYTDHSNWIRYEGPGIESDKVGYRIYLDWRNGFDIFGKLKKEPVLQLVGQDGYESYHNAQEWGMDILKVGNSLGAGGFGVWQDDKIAYLAEAKSRSAKIVENGPLRSSFSIDYKGWKSPVGEQDLSAHFAMQAGSRLVKVTLDIDKPVPAMVAGVVKHKDTVFIEGDVNITGKAYSYIASWGVQALDGSHLGMAVFFKKEDLVEVRQDEVNYFAVLSTKGQPTNDNPSAHELDYYFAAAWEKESGIGSQEDFVKYLEQEAEKLTRPARLRLKTQRTQEKLNSKNFDPKMPLNWSRALADSELARKALGYNHDGWDVNRQRPPKFEYDIVGLLPYTFHALSEVTDNAAYASVLPKVTASFITDEGDIRRYKKSNYNIDSVAPGRAVLVLYKQTGEEKYKQAASLLRQQLAEHPRTKEGAFWHKKIYPHQLWLDGVYMGMPFLAEYTVLFENGKALHEVVEEFVLTRKYLRDAQTGLYYHAWDESKQQDWAHKETGLSPLFWARGMGWFTLALVDVLEIIPQDQAQLREPLLAMAKEVAASLVEVQDPATGTWWQILDQPEAVGNYRESSASAMFVYFLAKAVKNGYIDARYSEQAEKGYQGLLEEFVLVHENGEISMTNQCYVAGLGFGRDGSYDYYMSEPVWENDPKGTFAFILAGLAMNDLQNR